MTTEYIIDEDVANKVCFILVNNGENRLANKICSRPHPAPAPEVWRCCEFLPRAINRKPEDCEMVQAAARQAREDILADKMLIIEEFHKILVHAHIDCATFLTGESVVNEIREVTKQSLRGERR